MTVATTRRFSTDGAATKKGVGEPTMPQRARIPPPAAPKNVRSIMPQILASLGAGTFHFCEGLSLSYSSALIPALQRPDSEIPITLDQGVILASVMVAFMAVGAPLSGVLMNRFGRLNTVLFSLLPFSLGWFLIATASSYEMILGARVLTGIANGIGVSASVVFTTEVAAPHVRGALNGANTTLASLGVVASYVLGKWASWRLSAWVCGASPLITTLLVFVFGHESPIWLVSVGRVEQAEKSLRAYARCNATQQGREELPKKQLEWLVRRHDDACGEHKVPWHIAVLDLFRQPVGYKPLLILTAVFVVQNFSGVYITLFYTAPFFQEMGVEVDMYEAAIYAGITRLLSGILAVGLIRKVGVRPLMVSSSLGMAFCMAVSGYFTLNPERGLGGWVAVVALLAYVTFSCCGVLTVPWTMTAEVYPDRLRDVGQACTIFVADLLLFAGLQLYPTLLQWLQFDGIPGAVGLQWFFAVVSLLSVALTVVFVPETHGKTLQEIEEHYKTNTLWLGRVRTPPIPVAVLQAVPTLSAAVVAVEGGLVVAHKEAENANVREVVRRSSSDSGVEIPVGNTSGQV